MPSDVGSLPTVTPAILQEELVGGPATNDPHTHGHWSFRWFSPVDTPTNALKHYSDSSGNMGDSLLASTDEVAFDASCIVHADIPRSQVLLVVPFDEAPEAAAANPGAFLVTNASVGADLSAVSAFSNRMLVIDSDETFEHLLLRVQNVFVRMFIWQGELDRIVNRQGTLRELLDAGPSMLKNFMFASDNDFNVIAYTTSIEPPDELHRNCVERGCLTQQTISEKRFRLPEKTFYARDPSDASPFGRLSYPVHVNHNYFGSVSMSCNVRPDTPALRDLFTIFLKYARVLCERQWNALEASSAPSYFFSRLLRGERMPDEYVTVQMEANGMAPDSLFKVVVFDADPSIDPELANKAVATASTLNNGKAKSFPYEHCVVAILASSGKDGELSHRKTLDELAEKCSGALGADVPKGISSVFEGIENIRFALKQAQIAIGFRKSIDLENVANENLPIKEAYLFEDALLYYLIDGSECDEKIVSLSFDISIVNILWREDIENETHHLRLLWNYLQSERNATETAVRLHMHRNTVIYHIDRIQKRFDFDLEVKAARDWLLVHFKMLFASLSNESVAEILSKD